MSFKPFFVHCNLLKHGHQNRKWNRTNGFTAYISPVDNPRELSIQITQCTGKDEFCKRIGREQAQLAEPLIINKRDIAQVLGEAYGFANNSPREYEYEDKYLWVLKYVV